MLNSGISEPASPVETTHHEEEIQRPEVSLPNPPASNSPPNTATSLPVQLRELKRRPSSAGVDAGGLERPAAARFALPRPANAAAAEWNLDLGTLSPEKFAKASLYRLWEDARVPVGALQKLTDEIDSGKVSLRGHPTQKGARGLVKLEPGTDLNGQAVPRSLGFQLQPGKDSDQWFLGGLSVVEKGKPTVIIINPLLLNHIDHKSISAADQQQMQKALKLNAAANTGLSTAHNALPSVDYLEQHGLSLRELMLEKTSSEGTSDDQLKTVLRRLAHTGKIDIRKDQIDAASRDQRIDWLKQHAGEHNGQIMLDMVGFLILPPRLTWQTSSRAFQAGSAFHGTDGRGVGQHVSTVDQKIMDDFTEARENNDITDGQYLTYANGLAQNLGFDIKPRTAGAS